MLTKVLIIIILVWHTGLPSIGQIAILSTFEESLSKIFMSAGFDVRSCKAIKGRGENSTNILNSLFMTNGNYIHLIFIGNVSVKGS